MPDFDELAAGLRAWAEGDQICSAAVELLIWHETWIRRADFIAACTDSFDGMTAILWDKAEKFAKRPALRGSTHEITMLQIAVAIGADRYRLAGKGRAGAAAIMRAFAAALGSEPATEWGVAFRNRDGFPIVRGDDVQQYMDEADARQARAEVEMLDPSRKGTVMTRQTWTGPWAPAKGDSRGE